MSNSIVPTGFGSTNLNPIINSYGDLVYRTKNLLGWPINSIELTDAQWATLIDEAVEIYTAWEGNRKEEYLVFCSDMYERGCGINLSNLVQVGCNTQYCYQTTVVETVTSQEVIKVPCGTFQAYLSSTSYVYPTVFNRNDPNSVEFTGTSGQYLHIKFDPDNPWDMNCVCGAQCMTIKPVHSQWWELSTNACLSGIVFDFENNSTISYLNSSLSAIITSYPMSAVPLTALENNLSAIPITYFNVSCFYPDNEYYGPPVSACVNIGNGHGYIYPSCNTSLINGCSALSAQYAVSNTWTYVMTSIPVTSVTISQSATDFATISSFFVNFCHDCLCNCAALSSLESVSGNNIYTFYMNKWVLSGSDGVIWNLSDKDISGATHVKLYNVPYCTTDGSIPLDSNNGIVGAFTLCNTALNTNGPMPLKKVQFFKDYKLPTEIIGDYCNINNNGFTLTYFNNNWSECFRHTPDYVPVDIEFYNLQTITNIGTVSSELSSNIDTGLMRTRKVLGVGSIDDANNGFGGFGGDLLFNFDYALLASTFGYDLQGTRLMQPGQHYDLVTYHLARSFVEHSRKMLRYVSYVFDPYTQYLRITPEPRYTLADTTSGCCNIGGLNYTAGRQCYILTVYVEPPIQECLSQYWVREFVLARAKTVIGQIRSKFSNNNIYGGVQINGDALIQEGNARIEVLMKELRQEGYYSPPAGGLMFIH